MTFPQRCVVLVLVAALVGPASTATAQPPSVTRHVLPNGMTVIVRENPLAPVVAVSLQVRTGLWAETPETAGITNLLVRTMIRGTAHRSGAALAETAEGRAYTFGRAETVWRLEEELAYVDRLRSVTRDQIRAAARRYLDPERYTRLAFVPPSR